MPGKKLGQWNQNYSDTCQDYSFLYSRNRTKWQVLLKFNQKEALLTSEKDKHIDSVWHLEGVNLETENNLRFKQDGTFLVLGVYFTAASAKMREEKFKKLLYPFWILKWFWLPMHTEEKMWRLICLWWHAKFSRRTKWRVKQEADTHPAFPSGYMREKNFDS